MTVTSRVRHLIEINADHGRIAFEFESHDIGATQGTTLTWSDLNQYGQPVVIARYRPCTRHWDTALEVAEQVLAKAVARTISDDQPWSTVQLGRELDAVLAEEGCMPWDGKDPNGGDDW